MYFCRYLSLTLSKHARLNFLDTLNMNEWLVKRVLIAGRTAWLWVGLGLVVMSCGGGGSTKEQVLDTCQSGRLRIAADETLAPLMRAEVQQFESTYAAAKFDVRMLPEAQAVADLVSDSVTLVLLPRPLRADEEAAIKASGYTPRTTAIGYDGIAVISHPANKDTSISLPKLKQLLTSEIGTWGQLSPKRKGASARDSVRLVVDNSGSSIVSYLQDSLLNGSALSKRIYALGTNEAVIEYVSKNPSALGLIGLSWISDPFDSVANHYLKQIRVMAVAPDETSEAVEPYQYYLLKRRYPLMRRLYVVHRQARVGLATCLTSFIAGERGQLIVHQLDLLPYYGPVRLIELKQGDYRN